MPAIVAQAPVALSDSDIRRLAAEIARIQSDSQTKEDEDDGYKYGDQHFFDADQCLFGANFRTFVPSEWIWNLPDWLQWLPVSRKYAKKVQYCLGQYRQYVAENCIEDVAYLRNRIRELEQKCFDLESQLAKSEGAGEQRKDDLQKALVTIGGGDRRINHIAQSIGMEPVKDIKSDFQGRENAGKFTSRDGLTKSQKICMAGVFDAAGCDHVDIGSLLNLSASSLKNYISDARKHSTIEYIDDLQYLRYDSTIGGEIYKVQDYSPSALTELIQISA